MDDVAAAPRTVSFLAICLVQAMVILDGTIVTVALPTIETQLGFDHDSVSWVLNAYLVAFAGLLLLAGRLGDVRGLRPVFLTGLAVFTASSLACGLADGPTMLLAARVLQGFGAGLASAVALALVIRLYPEPELRVRALGVFSFVAAAGSSLGFVAGGVLTDSLGWRWAFLLNVPLGVLALVLGAMALPRFRPAAAGTGVDVVGAVLLTVGVGSAVFAIVEPSGRLLAVVVAAVGLLWFVQRQRSSGAPLVDLAVVRRRSVWLPNVVFALAVAAGMGFQFVTAISLQVVGGRNAWDTGVAFLPTPVAIAVVSLAVAPRLLVRFGPRGTAVGGLLVTSCALVFLAAAPIDADYASQLLPGLVIAGLGMGAVIPAMSLLAMSGDADAGLASGLFGTSQQVGAAVGIATLAAVAASTGGASLAALHDGFALAYGAAAVILVVAAAAALGLRAGPGPKPEPPPRATSPTTCTAAQRC